jgi:hypothetical protein
MTAARPAQVIKFAVAFALIAASFVVTLRWLADSGGFCSGKPRTPMERPFQKQSGNAFYAPLPQLEFWADTSESPSKSPLVICEGDVPLGPPHSQHADITSKGLGRYSHWGTGVIFSTSDNSDPNTNGKRYSVIE